MASKTKVFCIIAEVGENKIESHMVKDIDFGESYDDDISPISYVFGLRGDVNIWDEGEAFMADEAVPFGGRKPTIECSRRTLSRKTFTESLGQCLIPNRHSVKMRLMYSTYDLQEEMLYKYYLINSRSLLPKIKNLDENMRLANSGIVRIMHGDMSSYINDKRRSNDFHNSHTKEFYERITYYSDLDIAEFLKYGGSIEEMASWEKEDIKKFLENG